jgi:hypothetical protein
MPASVCRTILPFSLIERKEDDPDRIIEISRGLSPERVSMVVRNIPFMLRLSTIPLVLIWSVCTVAMT